ncbi:hypothetical protein NMS_1974 [Nonlabens marinus S1-08]|uniref:Uncharacterized protein n=1 Tax=Nonlabens marinus S1-08 TaxID=1454201 RepID=W8VW35_9FLAO|nr:hypothetical protein NMS_1974 [Nonlabens marinus S1-08]
MKLDEIRFRESEKSLTLHSLNGFLMRNLYVLPLLLVIVLFL